jgi:hypothetical protein
MVLKLGCWPTNFNTPLKEVPTARAIEVKIGITNPGHLGFDIANVE